MGHLPLKIQTSALFLKAKHAFSLHRKSSSSNSASPTSLTSPALSNNNNNNTASSPGLLPATDSTASGTTSRTSSSASGSTNVTAALGANSSSSSSSSSSLTTGAGVIPHKMKRSSRFKMNKTFQSFRDRSTSPISTSRPTLTSSNSSATTVTAIATATTATAATATTTTTSRTPLTPTPTTTPPIPVYSSNPYSSSWSPSTVAILKSPLRTRSSVASSKPSGSDLDLKSPHYSPAPNLILQPTPAVDFAPSYGMVARLSTSPTLSRHQSSDKTLTTVMQFREPVIDPQE
ncbi:hypothetical protein CPB97_001406 [Podila verticillata]|nr:hypothetical protein CPB97_001406 [Podila verticillata]